MEENYNVTDTGCIFYPLNDEYLNIIGKDLSDSINSMGVSWANIELKEIIAILKAGMKLYHFQSNYSFVSYYRRRIPTRDQLDNFQQMFQVPRFIRDIYREMCRPMISDSTIYLPDVEYSPASAEVAYRDLFGKLPNLFKWRYAMSKLGFELFDIVEERTRPEPLSWFIPDKGAIYSVRQLSSWRIEAVSRLQHLVWFDKEDDNLQESASELERCDDVITLYNMEPSGRMVGCKYCFSYSVVSTPRRYGILVPTMRFPTFQENSRSPPRSDKFSFDRILPHKERKKMNLDGHG